MGKGEKGKRGEWRVYMHTEAGFLLTIGRTTPMGIKLAQGKHVCL